MFYFSQKIQPEMKILKKKISSILNISAQSDCLELKNLFLENSFF